MPYCKKIVNKEDCSKMADYVEDDLCYCAHCFELPGNPQTEQAEASSLSGLLNAEFYENAVDLCRYIYMHHHVSELPRLPKAAKVAWELGQKINEQIKQGI